MRSPPSHMNVGPIMNLINGIHHLCEKKKYVFMVLREYTIISLFSRNPHSSRFIKIIKLVYDFVCVINGTNGMLIYRKRNL